MKKWIGFTLVFLAFIASVAMPPAMSRDVLPVDNDVGYTFSIVEEAITITTFANDIQVPTFNLVTHGVLKCSAEAPVVCSYYIELGAGMFSCDAALVYNNLYHQGDRYDIDTSEYPAIVNSKHTKEITDYEGLYRLDIGECLWRS